jgi:hypothetical protein
VVTGVAAVVREVIVCDGVAGRVGGIIGGGVEERRGVGRLGECARVR